MSVIVEAHRNLVDKVEGMSPDKVGPRRLLICRVRVTNILDLRPPEAQLAAGLTEADLTAWDYARCRRVGQAAHQLGLHGVLAPAATGLGETLALFERHLPAEELPELTGDELWQHLPADPRRLRVVKEEHA